MADIFDEVASGKKDIFDEVSASGGGDIFDQIGTKSASPIPTRLSANIAPVLKAAQDKIAADDAKKPKPTDPKAEAMAAASRYALDDEALAALIKPDAPDAVTGDEIEAKRVADYDLASKFIASAKVIARLGKPNLTPKPLPDSAPTDASSMAQAPVQAPQAIPVAALAPKPATAPGTDVIATPKTAVTPPDEAKIQERAQSLVEAVPSFAKGFVKGATAGVVKPENEAGGAPGALGQTAGNLAGGLASGLTGPVGASAFMMTQFMTDLEERGIPVDKIGDPELLALAATSGLFGGATPIAFGKTLLKRALTGAAIGAAQNVAEEDIMSTITKTDPERLKALILGGAFGAGFGAAFHDNPHIREAIAEKLPEQDVKVLDEVVKEVVPTADQSSAAEITTETKPAAEIGMETPAAEQPVAPVVEQPVTAPPEAPVEAPAPETAPTAPVEPPVPEADPVAPEAVAPPETPIAAPEVSEQAAPSGGIERLPTGAPKITLKTTDAEIEEAFPRVTRGVVDGLEVRAEIPNQSSISASVENPEILPGVRMIDAAHFENHEPPSSPSERVRDLAERINESGEINPLIVVVDKDGYYVLEGAHRFDALMILGKKQIPAKIVLDLDSIADAPASSPTEQTPKNTPKDVVEGPRKVALGEAAPIAEAPKKPEPPPGATPTKPFGSTPDGIVRAPHEDEPNLTSAHNASSMRDREKLGMEQLPSPEREAQITAVNEAKERGLDQHIEATAAAVLETPRDLTRPEIAAIVMRKSDLKEQYKAVEDRLGKLTDPAEINEQARIGKELISRFDVLDRALRYDNSEAGRSLNFRKITLDKDFNLLPVLSRAKAARGRELTPQEHAKFEEMAAQIKEHEKTIADFEARSRDAQARESIKERARSPRRKPQEVKAQIADLTEKTRRLLRAGCLTS